DVEAVLRRVVDGEALAREPVLDGVDVRLTRRELLPELLRCQVLVRRGGRRGGRRGIPTPPQVDAEANGVATGGRALEIRARSPRRDAAGELGTRARSGRRTCSDDGGESGQKRDRQ